MDGATYSTVHHSLACSSYIHTVCAEEACRCLHNMPEAGHQELSSLQRYDTIDTDQSLGLHTDKGRYNPFTCRLSLTDTWCRSKCARLVAVQRPTGQAPLCLPSLSRQRPAEVPQLQWRRRCSSIMSSGITDTSHMHASDTAMQLKLVLQGSWRRPIEPPAHLTLLWKIGKQAVTACG